MNLLNWVAVVVSIALVSTDLILADDAGDDGGNTGFLYAPCVSLALPADVRRATGASAPESRTTEAKYDGKTITEWITLLEADDANIRGTAYKALARIGAPALPALVEEAFNGKDAQARQLASQAACVPREELRKVAAEVVPAVAQRLLDKDDRLRHRAVLLLWSFGPERKEALPVFVKALKDKKNGAWHLIWVVRAGKLPILPRFGARHRKGPTERARRLRTTNGLERINREIKQRNKTPNPCRHTVPQRGIAPEARLSRPQRDQRRMGDRKGLPKHGSHVTSPTKPRFTEEMLLYLAIHGSRSGVC